jgi:hypothetical protein
VADPALRFLEYVFLALLYLFFLRVLRAVWVELREPRVVPAEAEEPVHAPAVAGNGGRKGRSLPHQLAVMSVDNGTGESFALADARQLRLPGARSRLPAGERVLGGRPG